MDIHIGGLNVPTFVFQHFSLPPYFQLVFLSLINFVSFNHPRLVSEQRDEKLQFFENLSLAYLLRLRARFNVFFVENLFSIQLK